VVGRRRGMIFVLLGLLVIGLVMPPGAQAQPSACDPELDGPPSVYLGAWIPAAFDDPRLPLERDPYGQFTTKAGKRLAIVNRWEHWGLERGRIDVGWLNRVVQAGALPMVTWDPWDPNANPPDTQQQFLMRDVAGGAQDALIVAVADQLAHYEGPLFLRFAQEMNGTWYPWGKHQSSPAEYVAAWRHVHELFEQRGADQVTWVWTVSEKNHPEALALWYPGDDVVDWVAVDGYNWDDPNYWRDPAGTTWRTLDQIFGPSFADLDSFVPPERPRMIAETASTERPGDPALKADWICDAFRRALPTTLPAVQAVLWFNEAKEEAGRPFFWPLDSSPTAQTAFAAAVAPDYYLGNLHTAPVQLGRRKIPPPGGLPTTDLGRPINQAAAAGGW
jgi:mannan endo-1,4-beta-mannosidase